MRRGAGVIEEAPWWLEVNGLRVAAGTVRPPRIREMAAGRLRADGWILGAADLLSLEEVQGEDGSIGIRARVPAEHAAMGIAERDHRLTRGCGPLHFVNCEPDALRRNRRAVAPDLSIFPELFRELFAAADRASPVGGIHAAGLAAGGRLLAASDDVSRHNAVDKAIGAALLGGLEPGGLGLVVTARISGEMAQKAARAGIAWLASRSLPTTIAVSIAERADMPVIARAASADAVVHACDGAAERAS